jgi:multisubunit Na+/H+ antiporter MnhB subunit
MIKVLLRLVAVIFVAIGLFLIYAVIHAVGSAGGARVGVCVGYVAGALILGYLALRLWRRSAGPSHATA